MFMGRKSSVINVQKSCILKFYFNFFFLKRSPRNILKKKDCWVLLDTIQKKTLTFRLFCFSGYSREKHQGETSNEMNM